MSNQFKFGDFVGAANEHAVMDGVIVAIERDRALVCDNHFGAVMMRPPFNVSLQYLKDTFKCRWFKFSELELDEDDEDDDDCQWQLGGDSACPDCPNS